MTLVLDLGCHTSKVGLVTDADKFSQQILFDDSLDCPSDKPLVQVDEIGCDVIPTVMGVPKLYKLNGVH